MRRSNGEGTVHKRKDGLWIARAYVTLPNGTRKRVTKSAKKCEDAKRKLKELLEQENKRVPYTEKQWKVGEYLEYWLANVQQRRIRDTTMSLYRGTTANHIIPTLGYITLKDLSVHDIRQALASLETRSVSARVRLEVVKILRSCLNNAMREEIIQRNPAALVEKPKYIQKETAIWTAGQSYLFLIPISDKVVE